MAETAGDGGSVKATGTAATQVEKRVALGDLTNVIAGGGGFAAPDVQGCRERVEVELLELQKLKLELGSCKPLLSGKPDGSPYGDIPQRFADLQKKALQNSNKAGEAILAKESAKNATGELSAVSKKADKPIKDKAMLMKQEPRDGDDTSLKDMLSGVHGMDKVIRALERTIVELSSHQRTELSILDEKLETERKKVTSLERERDQLRSQVALLESKLDHGDYSASSTKVCMANSDAEYSEAKPELKKTKEWLQSIEKLKGKAVSGRVKKQPITIEIGDDEDKSMWCDEDNEPSIKSNPFGSGDKGGESCHDCHVRGSSEWFFRGNKLMLSCEMKTYLKELCGCVPPQIPFYIYQMNKSNLKRRGKMRLSANYICKPLLSFLHNGEVYARFEVDGEDCGTVRLKLLADDRLSLTSGWESVVEAKDIRVGDICAFHFHISDGVLKLSVYVFHTVRYLMIVR